MYHELIPLLEHAAPIIASALGAANPIAGTIMSVLSHTFNADPGNVSDLAAKISSDSDSGTKLQMIDKLLGTSPTDLLAQRQPSKVDLHLIIEYPVEQQDVKV